MLNYNDSSGDGRRAAGRDRTRRSYIRGAWASSSTIDSISATTQYLREPGSISAILAMFVDVARQTSVTVAQVLWEHDEQVRELYAVSSRNRNLSALLEGRANSTEIRRSARMDGWDIYDSFAPYAERMRSLLHIPGDKALEVFNRAIGMKEVGDIDAFIRQFMLPSADTVAFIRETVQPHYRTLLDCWTAITRAERQVELLRPVGEHGERVVSGEGRMRAWKRLQDLARPFFATRQIAQLRDSSRELADLVTSLAAARASHEAALERMRSEEGRLTAAMNASEVGSQLQRIDERVKQAEEARNRAQNRRYGAEKALVTLGDRQSLADATSFASARARWPDLVASETAQVRDAEERRATHKMEQERALLSRLELSKEVESVERNRVNIPRVYVELRSRIALAVNLSPDALPFAGELIEVLEKYADWSGAIERLLHGFGLSLLVPESSYRAAADFINRTPLGLRLVFFRVPTHVPAPPSFANDRVPGRLRFRTEHALCLWTVNEVVRRFNHRCCADVVELEQTDYGLTRQGLVRDGTRHIKDDGRLSDDASRRILGWSTEKKLAALRRQIVEAEQQATVHGHAAAKASAEGRFHQERADAARDLLAVIDFEDVSPHLWSAQLLALRSERELLERSSTELQVLRVRAAELGAQIKVTDNDLRDLHANLVHHSRELDQLATRLSNLEAEVGALVDYDHLATEAEFATLATDITLLPLTTINFDQILHTAHVKLQGLINREQGFVRDAGEKMTSRMSDFLAEFTEFRQTLSPERQFLEDFIAVMGRIEAEELPQYRARFEQYLNENLVGNLSMLNRRLVEHHEIIEGRIAEINLALRAIEYSDATYVQLHPMTRPNAEVSDFRRALRDCFERGIAPSPDERKQVFERVRSLLEGFQRDPERTQRVCDVRNWVSAGVRELRRGDDSEVNYYSATTGKSGGQKAKLAFTILASALSAQYGLSTAPADAPNFRLVVIDEAFSRTDESNSTRAMELFARLGFQLLIVGPFDAKAKLAVPFVKTIHLASNPTGSSSTLTQMKRSAVEGSKAATTSG